jgi:putative membrane protein
MRVLVAVMGAALLPAVAAAQASDQQFLEKAYNINQSEIALGKLAQEKGASAEVRDFGKRLESDHQKALEQLRDAAAKSHLTLPSKLESDTMHHTLSNLQGKPFDEAFIQHMVSGHQQAIDLYQQEADHGKDPALRAYAEKQLPVLKMHKDVAKRDLQRM